MMSQARKATARSAAADKSKNGYGLGQRRIKSEMAAAREAAPGTEATRAAATVKRKNLTYVEVLHVQGKKIR